MNITTVKPDIVKYKIRLEPNDDLYMACMWADVLIDHENYSIMAQTDCGDYSYRWPCTPETESFRDLCIRMMRDEGYLLDKFSARTEFDLEESRLLIKDEFKQDPDMQKMLEQIDHIYPTSAHEWVEILDAEFEIEEAWNYIVLDYPKQARTFVRLLRTAVLPMLIAEKAQEEK